MKRILVHVFFDTLALASVASIAAGVWDFSPPLALIVLGVLGLAAATLWAVGQVRGR